MFGWDIALAKSMGEGAAATPSGEADGGGALTYYLLIDGLNGGVQVKGLEGAFEVQGYEIDIDALINFYASRQ